MIKTMCLEVFKASSKLYVNVKVGIEWKAESSMAFGLARSIEA